MDFFKNLTKLGKPDEPEKKHDIQNLLAQAQGTLQKLTSSNPADPNAFPLLNECTRIVQQLEGLVSKLPNVEEKELWRLQLDELQEELKRMTERIVSFASGATPQRNQTQGPSQHRTVPASSPLPPTSTAEDDLFSGLSIQDADQATSSVLPTSTAANSGGGPLLLQSTSQGSRAHSAAAGSHYDALVSHVSTGATLQPMAPLRPTWAPASAATASATLATTGSATLLSRSSSTGTIASSAVSAPDQQASGESAVDNHGAGHVMEHGAVSQHSSVDGAAPGISAVSQGPLDASFFSLDTPAEDLRPQPAQFTALLRPPSPVIMPSSAVSKGTSRSHAPSPAAAVRVVGTSSGVLGPCATNSASAALPALGVATTARKKKTSRVKVGYDKDLVSDGMMPLDLRPHVAPSPSNLSRRSSVSDADPPGSATQLAAARGVAAAEGVSTPTAAALLTHGGVPVALASRHNPAGPVTQLRSSSTTPTASAQQQHTPSVSSAQDSTAVSRACPVETAGRLQDVGAGVGALQGTGSGSGQQAGGFSAAIGKAAKQQSPSMAASLTSSSKPASKNPSPPKSMASPGKTASGAAGEGRGAKRVGGGQLRTPLMEAEQPTMRGLELYLAGVKGPVAIQVASVKQHQTVLLGQIHVLLTRAASKEKDYGVQKRAVLARLRDVSSRLAELEAKQAEAVEAEDFEAAAAVAGEVEAAGTLQLRLAADMAVLEEHTTAATGERIKLVTLQANMLERISNFLLGLREQQLSEAASTEAEALAEQQEVEQQQQQREEDLAAWAEDLAERRCQLDDSRADADAKVADVTAPAVEEKAAVTEEYELLQAEVAQLRAQLEEREAAMEAAHARLRGCDVRIRSLASKYDRLLNGLRGDEAALAAEEARLEEEREGLQVVRRDARAATHAAQQHAEQLRQQADELGALSQDLAQEASALRRRVEVSVQAKAALAALAAACTDAAEQLEGLGKCIAEARSAAMDLRAQRAHMTAQRTAAEQREHACRTRLPEVEADKKAAAGRKDFKEAARLSAEAKLLAAQADAAFAEASRAVTALAELDAREAAAAAELQELEAMLDDARRASALASWRHLSCSTARGRQILADSGTEEGGVDADALREQVALESGEADRLAATWGFDMADLADTGMDELLGLEQADVSDEEECMAEGQSRMGDGVQREEDEQYEEGDGCQEVFSEDIEEEQQPKAKEVFGQQIEEEEQDEEGEEGQDVVEGCQNSLDGEASACVEHESASVNDVQYQEREQGWVEQHESAIGTGESHDTNGDASFNGSVYDEDEDVDEVSASDFQKHLARGSGSANG